MVEGGNGGNGGSGGNGGRWKVEGGSIVQFLYYKMVEGGNGGKWKWWKEKA